MTPEQIERMRKTERKVAKITCSDGELLEAEIVHVDDDHRDVIYDLVSPTTPEKYRQSTSQELGLAISVDPRKTQRYYNTAVETDRNSGRDCKVRLLAIEALLPSS